MLKKHFSTLYHRIFFLTAVCTIISLIFCISVSYTAVKSSERNRIEEHLSSTVNHYTQNMEREFYSLIQISQQLLPYGVVGQLMAAYIDDGLNDNRYAMATEIGELIVGLSFSNPNVTDLFYFSPEKKKIYFSSLSSRSTVDLGSLPKLMQSKELNLHAVHPSASAALSSNVISITRPVEFPDGREMMIYAEAKYSYLDGLAFSAENGAYPLSFLQVSQNGEIIYSTVDEFPVGSAFAFTGEKRNGYTCGLTKDYFIVQTGSRMGFYNALLLPVAFYQKELDEWMGQMALLVLFSVALFLLSCLMIRKLIYKPLHILKLEIDSVGMGNLQATVQKSGIPEFDLLFTQFNGMKLRIQQLMDASEKAQRERHKHEIDKLLYQINPHFLMNSLNSVNWMAKMRGQKDIADFITQLNYILGYSMGKTAPVATLRTELNVLEAYLKFQKTRYNYEYILDIEEGTYLDQRAARMFLQPLAENALHHGIEKDGLLSICVFHDIERAMTVITLADNGRGLTSVELEQLQQPFFIKDETARPNDRGIGLRYVRSVLESFYESRAIMTINSSPGKGTKITLLFPLLL